MAVPAAIGWILLSWQPDFVSATLAAALIGMASGTELDLLGFLVSRYFKADDFTPTYSYIYAGVVTAGAVSPMAFSGMQMMTGTYDVSFYAAAGLFLLGGATLLTLGRYPTAVKGSPKAIVKKSGEI